MTLSSGPSFQTFILRSNVLSLYRSFLRTSKDAPPHARGAFLHVYVGERGPPQRFVPRHVSHLLADELKRQIRMGFNEFKAVTEVGSIKYLVRSGHDQLKALRDSLGLSSTAK